MNTTRLFHFLFQGNLVKRIAVGLVLGILVALVNESVKNSAGIDLASSFGVLGQIFVKALRAVAPILIFFLVMAALANKKVGSKSNMKEIIVLYATATSQLSVLTLRAEALELATVQYSIAEKDFANGTIESSTLSVEKGRQSTALEAFEKSRFELTKSLMILEVITRTPILRK